MVGYPAVIIFILYFVIPSMVKCHPSYVAHTQEDRGDCPQQCTCNPDTKRVSCVGVENLSWMNLLSQLPLTTEYLWIHESNFTVSHLETFTEVQTDSLNNLRYLEIIGTRTEIPCIGSQMPCHEEDGLFARLPNLSELHLNHNSIPSINPGCFKSLQNLDILDLSDNSIEFLLEDDLIGLENIRVLNLSHNAIMTIHPYTFHSLISIEEIDLSSNDIEYLHPVSFNGLPHLREIYLQWNNLVMLHEECFSNITGLQEVMLHGNPLHCSCGLRWLVSTLTAGTAHVFGNTEQIVCTNNTAYIRLDSLANTTLPCTPPLIVKNIADQSIFTLNRRVLDCNASGYPEPSVYWITPYGIIADQGHRPWISPDIHHYRSSHQFIALPLKQDSRISVLSNGSLVFQHFRHYFSGEYTCVAENPGGVTSVSFNVTISTPFRKVVDFSLIIGGLTAAGFLVIGIIFALLKMCALHVCCKKSAKSYTSSSIHEEFESDESHDYTWYFHNLEFGTTPRPSPRKCATPAEEEDAERKFSENGANIMGTLVDARDRLRQNMGRQVVRIRSVTATGAKHVKRTSHKAMETIRESSTKTVQSLRDTSTHAVQTIRDSSTHAVQTLRHSGTHYAHRVRSGVVLGVESVKYHVQSMKEFCGTGEMSQTISTISVSTNVDSQECTEVCKTVTYV